CAPAPATAGSLAHAANIRGAAPWDCRRGRHGHARPSDRRPHERAAPCRHRRHSGTPCSRARRSRGRGSGAWLLLPGPIAGAVLVELATLLEAVEGIAAGEPVLLVLGDGVGERPAAGGHGLEALIAPAAIDIEIADGRAADEGAAVGRHILDAAP